MQRSVPKFKHFPSILYITWLAEYEINFERHPDNQVLSAVDLLSSAKHGPVKTNN